MHLTAQRPDLHRLLRDRSGATLIEFAFGFPFVLALGLYGIEVSNLAIVHQKVSQAALNLADNASRVGVDTGLPTLNLREVDMNDVLTGARLAGTSINLAERSRITVSSLENDGLVQRIHWQRCIGVKRGVGWDSSYGTTKPSDGTDTSLSNAGTLAPLGMGPAGDRVMAPPNSAVMFVEINYDYQPLLDVALIGTAKTQIHYTASFIVRDRRNLSQIFNPAPAAQRYTCDRYTAV